MREMKKKSRQERVCGKREAGYSEDAEDKKRDEEREGL